MHPTSQASAQRATTTAASATSDQDRLKKRRLELLYQCAKALNPPSEYNFKDLYYSRRGGVDTRYVINDRGVLKSQRFDASEWRDVEASDDFMLVCEDAIKERIYRIFEDGGVGMLHTSPTTQYQDRSGALIASKVSDAKHSISTTTTPPKELDLEEISLLVDQDQGPSSDQAQESLRECFKTVKERAFQKRDEGLSRRKEQRFQSFIREKNFDSLQQYLGLFDPITWEAFKAEDPGTATEHFRLACTFSGFNQNSNPEIRGIFKASPAPTDALLPHPLGDGEFGRFAQDLKIRLSAIEAGIKAARASRDPIEQKRLMDFVKFLASHQEFLNVKEMTTGADAQTYVFSFKTGPTLPGFGALPLRDEVKIEIAGNNISAARALAPLFSFFVKDQSSSPDKVERVFQETFRNILDATQPAPQSPPPLAAAVSPVQQPAGASSTATSPRPPLSARTPTSRFTQSSQPTSAASQPPAAAPASSSVSAAGLGSVPPLAAALSPVQPTPQSAGAPAKLSLIASTTRLASGAPVRRRAAAALSRLTAGSSGSTTVTAAAPASSSVSAADGATTGSQSDSPAQPQQQGGASSGATATSSVAVGVAQSSDTSASRTLPPPRTALQRSGAQGAPGDSARQSRPADPARDALRVTFKLPGELVASKDDSLTRTSRLSSARATSGAPQPSQTSPQASAPQRSAVVTTLRQRTTPLYEEDSKSAQEDGESIASAPAETIEEDVSLPLRSRPQARPGTSPSGKFIVVKVSEAVVLRSPDLTDQGELESVFKKGDRQNNYRIQDGGDYKPTHEELKADSVNWQIAQNIMEAARDCGLTKDLINKAIKLAKKKGGISNATTDGGASYTQDLTDKKGVELSDEDLRKIKRFSKKVQELNAEWGIYSGNKALGDNGEVIQQYGLRTAFTSQASMDIVNEKYDTFSGLDSSDRAVAGSVSGSGSVVSAPPRAPQSTDRAAPLDSSPSPLPRGAAHRGGGVPSHSVQGVTSSQADRNESVLSSSSSRSSIISSASSTSSSSSRGSR